MSEIFELKRYLAFITVRVVRGEQSHYALQIEMGYLRKMGLGQRTVFIFDHKFKPVPLQGIDILILVRESKLNLLRSNRDD